MKTNLRGMLATMLATGLLAACSSDGGNNPGTDAGVPTDMGVTTDMGGTDGATAPRAPTPRAPTSSASTRATSWPPPVARRPTCPPARRALTARSA